MASTEAADALRTLAQRPAVVTIDPMLGPELNDAALKVIGAAFGWVVPAQVTLDVIGAPRTVSA